MVLGKKVAIFDWERGRNSALRDDLIIDVLPMMYLCQLC